MMKQAIKGLLTIILYIVLLLGAFIVEFIGGPLAVLEALNVLGTAIPHSIETWFAALFLYIVFRGGDPIWWRIWQGRE